MVRLPRILTAAVCALFMPHAQLAATTFQTDLTELCGQFHSYDFNGDGLAEINELTPLVQERVEIAGAGRVLILVESRLLQPLKERGKVSGRADREADGVVGGGSQGLDWDGDLCPQLNQLVVDLAADGWTADLIEVDLPHHDQHQDGLHVLALREFLREVDGLSGVILVGRFPDAYLVRTCNWRKSGDITLHKNQANQKAYQKTPYLRRVPECVAQRADIVLADLDGRWENIYVQPRVKLPSTIAIFPDGIPEHGGLSVDVEQRGIAYEDFFHISDGRLELAEVSEPSASASAATNGDPQKGWLVTLFDRQADLECSPADLEQPNRIARPDIWVSRIDARGSALSPSMEIVGVNGEKLLDENGQPQVVEFTDNKAVPSWSSKIWREDPVLERQLLAEYLQRNHHYRTYSGAITFRPASIAHDLGSGYRIITKASKQWAASDTLTDAARKNADVKGRPDLLAFVEWMKHPAILRTVRAHSDPWGTVFNKPDVAALNAAVRSAELSDPLSWTREGNKLVPSLKAACGNGKLDFFLLRSLWASGQLPPQPSIYLHTGCDITSPPNSASKPFHSSAYASRAGGAALMFFGRGLALVGRAKVFYDEPKGFSDILASGGTLGAAWAQYFQVESEAPTWGKAGGDIGRKRSYFWSVLGDCTLRLNPGRP